MKKFLTGLVLLAAATLCIPGTASAQGTSGFGFGVSGGATFPVSDQADVYKTGWNGSAKTVWATVRASAPAHSPGPGSDPGPR